MFTASNDKTYSLDGRPMVLWEELGEGAPTLIALARLCSEALATNRRLPLDELGVEARAILYAARRRGAIEIKAVNNAFDFAERMLAVCIELDAERQLVCRQRENPELVVCFLDGFRQLCTSGLVLHHLFREFSLSRTGFEVARSIPRHEVQILDILAEEQVLGEI